MAHGAPLEPLNDKNHIVINSQKPIVPDALSPVEARKQDIRSRARDNKNVLTDLAQKEKEIAEKIKLQAPDLAAVIEK